MSLGLLPLRDTYLTTYLSICQYLF
jgi:hypothetical protein